MKVLICGGRSFDDIVLFICALTNFEREYGQISTVICGAGDEDTTGADKLAWDWAEDQGKELLRFPAKWTDITAPGAVVRQRKDGGLYNVLAGFARNEQMLVEGKPTAILAFPGGKGTWDMVTRGLKAGVEIVRVKGR